MLTSSWITFYWWSRLQVQFHGGRCDEIWICFTPPCIYTLPPIKENNTTKTPADENNSKMSESADCMEDSNGVIFMELQTKSTDKGIELDMTPDGIPPLRETPHLALGLNKSGMPALLKSYPTNNAKRRALIKFMQQYIYVNFNSILKPAMKIIQQHQRVPTHKMQIPTIWVGVTICVVRSDPGVRFPG